MTVFVVIVHVFVSLFLIVVILLQAGRGQGLSFGSFGGTPQSILGTKTASFLTRLTTICAVLFLFTCIILNVIETRKARSLMGPSQPISQVDFEKIKKALDEGRVEQGATKVEETVLEDAPIAQDAVDQAAQDNAVDANAVVS